MTSKDVSVTIELDTSKFEAAMMNSVSLQMRKIREAAALTAQRMGVFVYALDTFALTANQVEALYYTRGAMDARYETPAARDAYLRVLLRAGQHSDVAVAGFLRGWVEHRGGPATTPAYFTPLIWHRYLDGTKVEVSAG